ncbi:MAG: AAA family ATPase [Lachnospiraceae bacterium]
MELFVISLSRTCGGGAGDVAEILSKQYGISVYDHELLNLAAAKSGISENVFEKSDERVTHSLLFYTYQNLYGGEFVPPESGDFTSDIALFSAQSKVLRELANKESYIVIGRSADYVLRDRPNLISVFLYAEPEICTQRIMKRFDMGQKEAEKYIKKINKQRRSYCSFHTNRDWTEATNYHLCLDTGKLGIEKSAAIIAAYLQERLKG